MRISDSEFKNREHVQNVKMQYQAPGLDQHYDETHGSISQSEAQYRSGPGTMPNLQPFRPSGGSKNSYPQGGGMSAYERRQRNQHGPRGEQYHNQGNYPNMPPPMHGRSHAENSEYNYQIPYNQNIMYDNGAPMNGNMEQPMFMYPGQGYNSNAPPQPPQQHLLQPQMVHQNNMHPGGYQVQRESQYY